MREIEVPLRVTTELDDKIQDLAPWQNTSWNGLCIKAIKTAYYVKNQWEAERVIYSDGLPLGLPWPLDPSLEPMNTIKMTLTPELKSQFEKTCTYFSRHPHTIIDWGIECGIILADAMLLHEVYAQKTGEHHTIPCSIQH